MRAAAPDFLRFSQSSLSNFPMKINFYFAVIPIVVAVVSSCKKGELDQNIKPVTPKDPDVYAAGYLLNGEDDPQYPGTRIAAYWKNGVLTDLPNSFAGGYATSIALVKGDVMIPGTVANNNHTSAVYWCNGMIKMLTVNGTTAGTAVSTTLDFYIAGTADTGAGYKPCYWKNGVLHTLPASSYATATAIAVEGNDVYVSGQALSSAGSVYALYWKNDVPHVLSDTAGLGVGGGYSIAIQGNNVYVAGVNNGFPACWKNGVAVALPGNSIFNGSAQATCMALQGSNIYIAGSNTTDTEGDYWKNDVITALSSSTQYAYQSTCLALSGNNVYVGGRASKAPPLAGSSLPVVPAYWRDTSLTLLPYRDSGGGVMGIALVPHQ